MLRQSLLKVIATLSPLLFVAGPSTAQDAPAATTAPIVDSSTPAPSAPAGGGDSFKSLDEEVQALKKEVLDLNRELFVLEEELLFPANTQVAVFVSMDVGEFFALDSVTLKLDNKEVANYLYTEREAQALLKGGVHRVFIGNLKAGEHELIALFTGQGPNQRDYRRGATIKLEKGVGAKYVELKISDKALKAQPEFIVKEWE
ncbi:AraC family transcriptional regulator [Steroidobacter flavus]|uniref:AraC family transcriptional regulator n=1 Tax=Steroidobacter flavus TaxID=1842136 RepID=A0ABV8SUN6_9GAMM